MIIKLNCPACNQSIEAPDEIMNEQSATCPTCAHEFKPKLPPTVKRPPAYLGPKAAPHAAERIETIAGVFTLFSIISAFIGLMGVFIGLVSVFGAQTGADGLIGWEVAGACFGSAVSLFVVAQIIHIRALLARKP
jgi:hypothetical protein